MESFKTLVTVKKSVTPDQFMRQLLIEMACDEAAPNDICSNASFDTVQESVKEVIVCHANVETHYNASVGYDRKEQYIDKEKKYDSSGNAYYVNVVKERTVTDWNPYSGEITDEAHATAFNEGETQRNTLYSEHNRLVPIIKGVTEQDMEEIGDGSDVKVSIGGLKTAKGFCASMVEDKVEFPGDHVKDKSFNSLVKVEEMSCYRLPFYEVSYKYKSGVTSYKGSGFACSGPNAAAELPANNIDIEGTAKKKTKGFQIGMICSFLASLVFLGLMIGGVLPIVVGLLLFFAFIGVSAALYKIGEKVCDSIERKMTTENNAIKLNDLKAALESRGFEPPSDLEVYKLT